MDIPRLRRLALPVPLAGFVLACPATDENGTTSTNSEGSTAGPAGNASTTDMPTSGAPATGSTTTGDASTTTGDASTAGATSVSTTTITDPDTGVQSSSDTGTTACDDPETCEHLLWGQQFGGSGDQSAWSVTVDGAGDVIVAGIFYDTLDLGGPQHVSAGAQDMFLAKFDASGAYLWSKQFGNATSQYPYDVDVDGAGNIYFVGIFEGAMDLGGGPLISIDSDDTFAAKFDTSGAHLWSKSFGGNGRQEIGAIAFDDDAGSLYMIGEFVDSIDLGGGPLVAMDGLDRDLFVARFDTAGTHVWSKQYGGPGAQSAGDIAVNSSGEPLVTGVFFEAIDFTGEALLDVGNGDIFVAKLDADGDAQWSSSFGDGEFQSGYQIAMSGENILVGGYFHGTLDFGGDPLVNDGGDLEGDSFLIRLDPLGNPLWSVQLGGPDTQSLFGMAVDGDGGVHLTGELHGSMTLGGVSLVDTGGGDLFLLNLDAAGDPTWGRAFGDDKLQFGNGVAVSALGDIYVVGAFDGAMDLGDGPLVSGGSLDLFVAKFRP